LEKESGTVEIIEDFDVFTFQRGIDTWGKEDFEFDYRVGTEYRILNCSEELNEMPVESWCDLMLVSELSFFRKWTKSGFVR
jgi:hypothetical protein